MSRQSLETTANALVAKDKGLLAADDDAPEMFARFAALGIAGTRQNLHDYWEILFAMPGIADYISGVILCEEALKLDRPSGLSFAQQLERAGILAGIVADSGTRALDSGSPEFITLDLDGLADCLASYARLGARFSKWRAVITIGDNLPSRYCIEANALALARFASVSQRAGLVPIVEPDVLMDGNHSLDRCREVTEATLASVFKALANLDVMLEGIVLKPNMVLPARGCRTSASIIEVAAATLDALGRCVPSAVPGIAFLSGGQSDQLATAHLNAINALRRKVSWELTFCFGRALQTRPLTIWNGNPNNAHRAQEAFRHRARLNAAACSGRYNPAMENDSPIVQPVGRVGE